MASMLSALAELLLRRFRHAIAILDFIPLFFRSDSNKCPAMFPATTTLNDLADQIHHTLLSALTLDQMLVMSRKIQAQSTVGLQSSPACMLPSFTHLLPSGREQGTYLAIDVGGSTFRVALVRLYGGERQRAAEIVLMSSARIDASVRALEGQHFFDWMAAHIEAMLCQVDDEDLGSRIAGGLPLPVGLSWSFPIDQTSARSGRLIPMGKGFRCSNGTVGQDLSLLIEQACQIRNISIRVEAIVNDSSATLLSQAYSDPRTCMSLILGTGTNVALHFPVHGIAPSKFGVRPESWFECAQHVLINTELSMFGGGILPTTRWDEHLNRTHLRPNYQPLEYLTSGQYLGEIVRLILVEAVESAHLLSGDLPHSLRQPYSLRTETIAFIEADSSSSLSSSASLLQKEHTLLSSPSVDDLVFIQRVCSFVSQRAAAYLATAIHSMWCMRNEAECSTAADGEEGEAVESMNRSVGNLSIACDGSVINKYPGFKDRCQAYLDQLTLGEVLLESDGGSSIITDGPRISLELAPESAILGAAVAVAVAVADGSS